MLQQYDDYVALSHDSAVVRLEGPTYGLDLTSVHLTHLPAITGRRNVAGIVHHEGTLRVLDVTRSDGDWLTSPARTVLDVAMSRGVEAGIVVADDFIRRKLTSKEELWLVYECVKDWPGALILRLVIERCDGRSESVGETLAASSSVSTAFRCRSPSSRSSGPTDPWPAGRTGPGRITHLRRV